MVSSRMSALMTVVLMILVAGITTTIKVAEAQGETPSCESKLVPCANFINSTKPPPSCCNPLREAVTKDLDCLCNLYANPALLSAFKINVTQALKLPGYCGIPGDLSACKALAPGSSSSETPPAQNGGKDNNNGVGKIAGTGLTSLLLALASLMLS